MSESNDNSESPSFNYLKEYRDRKDAAIEALKAHMRDWQGKGYATSIVLEFNGAGDSGDVYPYDLRDKRKIENIFAGVPFPEDMEELDVSDDDDDEDEESENADLDTFYNLMYDLLTGTLPGWEINEGSSGFITLEFTNSDTQQIEVNMRVIEEHNYTF
jgi:hypothetical protein